MRLKGFGMGRNRIVFYSVVGAAFLCMVRPKPIGADRTQAEEITQYVERVLADEAEFALKSPADKNLKGKVARKYRCMKGHWCTIDGKSLFICD